MLVLALRLRQQKARLRELSDEEERLCEELEESRRRDKQRAATRWPGRPFAEDGEGGRKSAKKGVHPSGEIFS